MSDINITIRLASKAATDGLDRFGAGARKAEQRLTLLERATRQVDRSLNSFVGNLGANLAFRAFNGIIRGIGATLDSVRAFETALVGVGKTTGLAGADLAELGQVIEDLSKEIPVASTELLSLAQTAAQLGIKGTDNIVKFTDTMARLAVATDIVGETGAIAFARIINITGENVQSVDQLGSAIVALGNNFAATESQILAVSNEVAKGGARFGLTAEQVLGLSAAMASLGVESQVAGSTTQKVFALTEKAIGKGGAELKKFTDILGLNETAFINLFETNPQQFFVDLIKGLRGSRDGGKRLSTTLAELGFQDLRVTKTLGPLIDRTDELTRAVDLSSSAYQENKALIDESEAAFDTLDSDLQDLSNTFFALTNTILRSLLPAISAMVKGLTSVFDVITENLDIIVTFGVLSAAAFAVFSANVALTIAGLGAMEIVMIAVRATAATMWATINLPATLAVLAIAAVTAVVVVLIRNWDDVTLSILKAASATTKFLGITIPGLDDELKRLSEKVRLNDEVIKRKEEELRLEKEIKTTTGADQARAEQRAIRRGGNQEISSTRQDTEADLARRRAEELRARQQQELTDLKNFGEQKNALVLEQKRAQFIADDELGIEREEFLIEEEANKLALKLERRKEFLARELGLDNEFNKIKIDNEKKQNDREIATAKAQNDAKLKLAKTLESQKASIQQAGFGLAAAVAKDGSKAQLIIQKAAAIAQLVVAKGLAVGAIPGQVALLPFGAREAAAARLLGQAELSFGLGVATVVASAIKGFQDGGIVGGSSFSGDNVLARVNSGEMILNQQQQARLFEQANGRDEDDGPAGDTVIQIDGEEVFRVVSRQVANGGVLGEGGV
jgi:TP901 family phage tail tape measure protein